MVSLQRKIFIRQRADDFAEDAGAGGDVLRGGVFSWIVADAVAARNENHAGRSKACPVHAVVAGAARHLKMRKAEFGGRVGDELDDMLVHDSRFFVADRLDLAGDTALVGHFFDVGFKLIGDFFLRVSRDAADIDAEFNFTGDDVHDIRRHVADADRADDGRTFFAGSELFELRNDFGRGTEAVMTQMHRRGSAVVGAAVQVNAETGRRGNACHGANLHVLMLEDFALLDMRFEEGLEGLLVNGRFDVVRGESARLQDFAQTASLLVLQPIEVILRELAAHGPAAERRRTKTARLLAHEEHNLDGMVGDKRSRWPTKCRKCRHNCRLPAHCPHASHT